MTQIASNFLEKPKLKEPFPDTSEFWVCPKTGLSVPKRLGANLEYRKNLLERAEKDTGLQRELMAACKLSPLYWFNTFVWTYRQFDVDPATGQRSPAAMPHHPFITWAIQDDLIEEIGAAIYGGYSLGIKKSRDMGASWICIARFHHTWLFRPESQLLEMSRTREYVDLAGNMKALFQRHDYINSWLPAWMVPPHTAPRQRNRTRMHMMNELNGSCIDGESTTEHAGSGDRRLAILLDEFAKVENGAAMRSATTDVAPCRIVNSTPGETAHTEYSRWINSGQIKVFVLPYWEHPEKGAGRYIKEDPVTHTWEIRSPWFDAQEKERGREELAREVLMKDIEVGEVFFPPQRVAEHRALFGMKNPIKTMDVRLNSSIPDEDIFNGRVFRRNSQDDIAVNKRGGRRPLAIYGQLGPDGRPDQSKTYTLGIDISKGQGASNSAVAIICDQTLEKIAEWADAHTPPHEMFRVIIALAIWTGGRQPRKLPYLIWEKNGPGWDVGRLLVVKAHYPFYYRGKTVGKRSERKTAAYGWQNNKQNNSIVLGNHRRMFDTGRYREPSYPCLEEMLEYIHYPNGFVGPASLVEESDDARKTHGDRVRATALALHAIEDAPKLKKTPADPPVGTVGDRMKQTLARRKAKNNAKRNSWRSEFDFTRAR